MCLFLTKRGYAFKHRWWFYQAERWMLFFGVFRPDWANDRRFLRHMELGKRFSDSRGGTMHVDMRK